MNGQITEKEARQVRAYLKSIQTYSALVEAIVSKACTGGVGTAQRKQRKPKFDEDAIRAKFHK